MRITSWTKKIAAALVAIGIFVSASTSGAMLDTNLLQNPGFEIVGTTFSNGAYLDDPASSWSDGTGTDYTYSHASGFANGSLSGGGLYFFSANFAAPDNDVLTPGVVSQLVDVSTGDTAIAIAAGKAVFNLGGFFSSYDEDGDIGIMQIDFFDSSSNPIAAPVILSDSDTTTWTEESVSGQIPIGTSSLFVSLYGQASRGGPDGYIDNVSLTVSQVPEPTAMGLIGIGLFGLADWSIKQRNKE